MREHSLKADAETHRLVSDLAYFLGVTKKHVLAEAVAGYAAPRLPETRERRPFTDLPVRQRLILRRDELLRAFERYGASDVRLIGPFASGEDVDLVEILAETDLMMGGDAVDVLSRAAREILATPVEVTSATAVALFDPERLELLRAESTPL
ncbi:hypothetical protein SAMN05428970_2622 [Agromyces sp. CF514]|uniref:hypothetical protein n=1 Tax=Agromyces sp. CF514 TaxID=1881031 RepID=UPI0008EB6E14|nr:hypothetical protein [Agromyces sp. CF514]SFR82536.1 hypothetical protein SAMN05428970_2622 [Agromyces sp. CF514]